MNKAMQAALRFLTRREYSRHELSQKLRQQFSESEVCEVIEECCRNRLLSDVRFVESRVRHRVQQGYGPLWIKQDLRLHQLDDDLLRNAMDYDESFWIEKAQELVVKKYGTLDIKQHMPKIQRYLYQRGYSAAVIQQALKRVFVINN
jgi:regulatory protein